MALRYGDVQFVSDGKTYTVRYGNLAWDELRRKLGSDTSFGCLLKARQDPEAFLAIVHEGLGYYQPELTRDQARLLYDEIPRPGERNLSAAVWEAIELSLPEIKAVLEGARPKAVPAAPPSNTRKPSRKPH